MPSSAVSTSTPAPSAATADGLNLVVLRGTTSSPTTLRTLPSGRRLALVALRVPGPEARATSVPVAVWEPPAWVGDLAAGEDLVVVGTVRRRFFRDGRGQTASRVEVEAATIGRGSERRRRVAAARRAARTLEPLD
jgi:single-strand DNA-binding protein